MGIEVGMFGEVVSLATHICVVEIAECFHSKLSEMLKTNRHPFHISQLERMATESPDETQFKPSNEFIVEMSTLQAHFIDDCIKLIDKYEYDRNISMLGVINTLVTTCEIVNFSPHHPTETTEQPDLTEEEKERNEKIETN